MVFNQGIIWAKQFDMPSPKTIQLPPLSDAIIFAVSKLVDDAKVTPYREPSHSDLKAQIDRAGLAAHDPNQNGESLGKRKRLRYVLAWALDNDLEKGGKLVRGVLGLIQGCRGFSPQSPNYVGGEYITTAIEAFGAEGFDLTPNGDLSPKILDSLSGLELSDALRSYVTRAKKGVEDAALLTGTGKDLLEATAGHVLMTVNGPYSKNANFPMLLGQAFTAIGMSTPPDGKPGTPMNRLDRSLYEAACAINTLRNKEGTGHGRPWDSAVSKSEARTAVQTMGVIAERMLDILGTI